MIDAELFAKEFQELCNQFKRKWDTTLAARYYDEISERLDDERFVDVCRKIFYEFDRFPRPIDFVSHATTIDDVLGPKPAHNPHDITTVLVVRGSPNHERIKHSRQRWEEGKDYWVDSRGYRCTVLSRHHQNEEGHGFPIPITRIV